MIVNSKELRQEDMYCTIILILFEFLFVGMPILVGNIVPSPRKNGEKGQKGTEKNRILFRRELLQFLVYQHAHIIISQGHNTIYIYG